MIKDKDGVERYSLTSDQAGLVEVIKGKINRDDDMVLGIVFGPVGGGKSVWAQQMAHAVDPTIDIDRVCFDKGAFIRAAVNNKKKAMVGDEGITLFHSKSVMTKEGREMSELMAQIRGNNLFVLVCVPLLLTIDSTVLEHANFVAYVWESKKEINGRKVTVKGNMAVYPKLDGDNFQDRIVKYLKIKKRFQNKFTRMPDPWCRVPGNPIGPTFKKAWYPVGEEAYLDKKVSILKKYEKVEEKEKEKPKQLTRTIKKEAIIDVILNMKSKNPNFSDKKIGELIGYSDRRVFSLRNEGLNRNSETNINSNSTMG